MYIVIEKVHVLFTGTNGHVTRGITVKDPDFNPKSGKRETWTYNDHVLRTSTAEELNISEADHKDALAALAGF